ncbi:MAG: histidine kinase [Acidovorax sp.]|nr:histidine kinase [Acidovorax sp.]
MHNESRTLTPSARLQWTAFAGFFAWVLASLGLVAFFVLSPSVFSLPGPGLRLGTDWPQQMLVDPEGRLTVEEVAALPDAAFTVLHGPLNGGYNRSVYWLRASAPRIEPRPGDPLWLEITPSYLDRVTLYQPGVHGWQEQHSGDTVPMAQRVQVRQLVFPLAEAQPLILRVDTSSSVQVYGAVWRGSELMARLSSVEWASGVHQGINLLLALLIGGAALALRMRSLTAMAVLSAVVLVHGANVRGYAQVWLPSQLAPWGDLLVSVGVFVLPAAFAWQVRELLTRGTRWHRIDKVLLALIVAPLLAIASIPLGRFHQWATLAVSVPWAVSALGSWVAWSNLRREGPSIVGVLMVVPYSLHAALGLHVAAAYSGWVTSTVEVGVFWQLEALLLNILIAVAVGLSLVEQFRASVARQAQLVDSLARSEQALEERVRLRTTELLQAQNALQAALHSEREMRVEQRHFFNMINHEFRTPLAVVDSAATELWTFPSPDLDTQVERAAQIRRACRRLTTLVDNCLVSDRLEAPGFRLRPSPVSLAELADEVAQIVAWSPRHRLALSIEDSVSEWVCDPTLVHIALSNLVDNAVKYAQAGEIRIAAWLEAPGVLGLSVADEGPGLPPEAAQRIFERGERGERSDQARGFGLGLWVARRIARLHGGDARVAPSGLGGTCFTLTLSAVAEGVDTPRLAVDETP